MSDPSLICTCVAIWNYCFMHIVWQVKEPAKICDSVQAMHHPVCTALLGVSEPIQMQSYSHWYNDCASHTMSMDMPHYNYVTCDLI